MNIQKKYLERGGVYLPDHISVEFMKKDKSRPKSSRV